MHGTDYDAYTTKVHIDPYGTVWTATEIEEPVSTGRDLIGFLLQQSQRQICWRLMGLREHAQLLMGLRQSRKDSCVEVCSPDICLTAADRRNPVTALCAMRRNYRPTSLGGFHTVVHEDDVQYALVSALTKAPPTEVTAAVWKPLLHQHPAWPALSFLPNINEAACAQLLAEIVDPRWFIDLAHPNRGSKLRSYLGLRRSVGEEFSPSARTDRGQTVAMRRACADMAWYSEPCPMEQMEMPNRFLYRILLDDKYKSVAVAQLRATQAFIEYLRLAWLANLGAGKHRLEALFVPEYFFKRPSEAQAYRNHLRIFDTARKET